MQQVSLAPIPFVVPKKTCGWASCSYSWPRRRWYLAGAWQDRRRHRAPPGLLLRPNFREFLTGEVPKVPQAGHQNVDFRHFWPKSGSSMGSAATFSTASRLLGTRVNRISRRAPGRARKVSRHTSRSGWALLTVPPYSTLDGFPERCRLVAELSLEPGVIYDERFLELVEHLDRLADGRVEET